MMAAKKPKGTTFRLDPDIRERVDRYAETSRRSLNGAVNHLLARALDAEDREAEEGKTQE